MIQSVVGAEVFKTLEISMVKKKKSDTNKIHITVIELFSVIL